MANAARSGLKDVALLIAWGGVAIGVYDVLTRRKSMEAAQARQQRLEDTLAMAHKKLDELNAKFG